MSRSPKTRTEQVQFLRDAIKASGLSARRFATEAPLPRDERTVRRWLAGDSPIPGIVQDRLEDIARDGYKQVVWRLYPHDPVSGE
jgi:hypothetical protein